MVVRSTPCLLEALYTSNHMLLEAQAQHTSTDTVTPTGRRVWTKLKLSHLSKDRCRKL